MMSIDDESSRKMPVHEMGMALDVLSIEELDERIGLLEAEIVRLRDAIGQKNASRSAADSVFKI